MTGPQIRLLRQLGSHSATLILLGLMALVVAGGLAGVIGTADWIGVPLAGLVINLAAALAAHGSLRGQPMLFAFHALLGLLVLLIGADQLSALRGHVEMTEGAMFDPAIAEVELGPLHPYALDEVAFVQGGFEIRYLPGMKRRETVSHLRVPSADGSWREARIGDDDPLVVGNYRFYTSFNKGFAPVVSYIGPRGQSITGAVHLPSYPLRDFEQGNTFTPPEGDPLTLWLSIPEPVYDPDSEWAFRKPDNPVLVVITGETRQELRLGEVAGLSGGAQLRFDALRTWMGYTISANPLTPWIIATAMLACIVLMVHIWEKLAPAEAPRRATPEAGYAS